MGGPAGFDPEKCVASAICSFAPPWLYGPSPYENVILAPYSSAEWISQASIMEAATKNAIKAAAGSARPWP